MSDINREDKQRLLKEHKEQWMPGSQEHELRKLKIVIRCAEDIEKATKSLEESMNRNAESSHKLANRIFWLTVLLAVVTIIGTFFGIWGFFLQN
jgi:hypothetical protein